MERGLQASVLAAAGARDDDLVAELLRYNQNAFDLPSGELAVPLADEPFVATWAEWAEAAARDGVFAVLERRLPQLRFPIRAGISQSDDYRAATLRGVAPDALDGATGLTLERPEALRLELYPSFAGRVPVIEVRSRPDFVTLVRALAKRNEPAAIPDGQGALMLAGYSNWQRIHALRRAWAETAPEDRERPTWGEEFAWIRTQKPLFQDRFMILSDGPYSAVPASDLGLDDETWRETSLRIRREHECAHYFTRRVFGSMRNHLLDELIADYTGLVAAVGRFRAGWFLRFLGLEDHPRYRPGTRLDLYRGDPPLSDRGFAVLRDLLVTAARTLERYDRETWPEETPRPLADRARMVRALASFSLIELAAEDGGERLARRVAELGDSQDPP